VQTACSTSLAAVHVACRGLLNHEADMAMAGGVWVNQLHEAGYRYQPGAILSPDGHCRAFDSRAAGTVIGSGVGIVVLKRLGDALADGDTIHAVIKGSAMNNDGSAKAGYTAPSVEGQAEVILAAQAIAAVAADTISYVETHGTGTTIGDPIEVAALTQAFRETTDGRGFCGIGSVKTNVGHLDAAAGVAGLIKTVLALEHKTLPPSLNFEQPNPQIDFSTSPFYVNTKCKYWPGGSMPRRAGVSSFGIGGTNVHVIAEEAPPTRQSGHSRPWQVLTLSARSTNALEMMIKRLREQLEAHPELPLADVAYTLKVGRKGFAHRAIALCRDRDDALHLLKSRESDRFISRQVVFENSRVTFLFPGQGAQYVNMARDLYRDEPVFREEFDRCAEALKPHLDFDLRALVYPVVDSDQAALVALAARLAQTEVAQPGLFVVEYALARLWMSWGVQPGAMLGHSIGEYVAACLAGVFSLEDALRLVAARGRLLQRMETGAMLVVTLPEAEIAPYLEKNCDLAAINGPELCVLSGPLPAIDAAEKDLMNRGVGCRRLQVSHAFHSEMIEPMLPIFADMVAKLDLHSPQIPFLSNLSGDWITAQEATDPQYWKRHLRGTVRFDDGVRKLLSNPNSVLLEVGPGETLATLAQRHPESKAEQVILSSLPHPSKAHLAQRHFYMTLGKLWLGGIAIDWNSFYSGEWRRRVPLPGYPFERQSYWVKPKEEGGLSRGDESNSGKQESNRSRSGDRSMDEWFYAPSWQRGEGNTHDNVFVGRPTSILIFTDEHGLGPMLIAHLQTNGIEPIVVYPGLAFRREDRDRYSVRAGQLHDFDLLLRGLRDEGRTIGHVFHLWSIDRNNETCDARGESQARNFFSLFYFAQAMESNKALIPTGTKVEMTVVTNGLEDVTGNELLHPEKAVLLGPCKVIPQEYSYLDCRIIDIELPEMPAGSEVATARLVRQIMAESERDAGSVVAFRGPHRWIQTFESTKFPPRARSCFRQGGIYFITGGLGGIGLTLAEHLARTRGAKLALLGRTPIPSREHWSKVLSTTDEADSVRRKIEKIIHLEAMGAEVLVLQTDVAIQAELRAAVDQTRRRFGAIHGVIHSAGEVGSGLISAKTEEMIEKVFAPKVQGTDALYAVFKKEPLDFMLFCSSLATIAGGLSKVDYAAANAYLDSVARAAYRESAYPVISVNWDSWRNVGMAANMAMPDGVGIAPDEGAEAFEHIVNSVTGPQVIVSTLDLNTRLKQTQQDLVAQPLAFVSSPAQARYPRPSLQTIFKSPDSELEKGLAEIWQSLLGIDAVGIHDDLFELGGDSLLGIQLLSRIRAAFSVDLHPADFFRSPTIAGLAALVEARLLDEIECA
jgi:acyl transferase domain-containing protein/acyl carrier protein